MKLEVGRIYLTLEGEQALCLRKNVKRAYNSYTMLDRSGPWTVSQKGAFLSNRIHSPYDIVSLCPECKNVVNFKLKGRV